MRGYYPFVIAPPCLTAAATTPAANRSGTGSLFRVRADPPPPGRHIGAPYSVSGRTIHLNELHACPSCEFHYTLERKTTRTEYDLMPSTTQEVIWE